MSLTSIVSNVFKPRQKELEKYLYDAEHMQHKVLMHLINKGKNTEYGVKHLLNTTDSYEKFAKNVPVNSYEELKGDIDRMRHGEQDVLWPGTVKWYAKSSGTTNDKSKFIPVSRDGLHGIHYAGGFDAVAYYLRNNPKSKLFDGKSLILGGSHSPNYNVEGSLVGDLSAILIENINPLANLVRVPKKQTALLSDFEQSHHQRRRYARPVAQPERDAAHHVCHADYRRARHDAVDQSAAHRRHRAHAAGSRDYPDRDDSLLAAVLPRATASPGRRQRHYRGGLCRPECHSGVRPRRGLNRGVRPSKRPPLY